MNWRRIIIIVVVLAGAAAGIYGWKEYHRKNADLAGLKPAYVIKASDLIKEYSEDESSANKKFLGKIVSVEGLVKKINHDADGYYTVILGDTADLSSVWCAIDTTHSADAANLKPISSVRIKGFVTGFNKDELGLGADVRLNQSVVEKHNN